MPVVFLSGIERGRGPATAIRQRADLERVISPARTIYYRAVWPMLAKPGTLGELPAYPAGIEVMVSRIDGLVVMLHPAGGLTSDVLAEIRAARAAGLPILVRAPGGGLVPLVDCRIRAGVTGYRVDLPGPAGDNANRRATLTAALAAIGARA